MKKYHHVTVGKAKKGDRVRTLPFGSSILALLAYPKGSRPSKTRAKRGKGKGRVISLRFRPSRFTLAQAKKWAKDHGYRVLGTAKADVQTKKTPKRRKVSKGK